MSNSAFTPTVLTVPATGGGGTGQGELSLITNGSAVTDITGWTNVSRVTSNSPLNPVTPTAFSISNAAAAESFTSGGYASFTLPSGLQNRKLKVEFYYTTPATDVYRVSVYKGSTRVALSTDSSNVTTLPPNTTGKFVAYFDTDASASWSLNVTRTSGTTGPCYITNVVCGPGIQPQGAVVGEWTDFTPGSFIGTPPSTTLTLEYAKYSRVGDKLHGKFRYVVQVFNYSGSAQANNNIVLNRVVPSGLTIPTAFTSVGGRAGFGKVAFFCPSGAYNVAGYASGFMEWDTSIGGIKFLVTNKDTATAGESSSAIKWGMFGNAGTAGSSFGFIDAEFEVPINEWAGSGTVQLAQNDVEYAWNSDPGTTAGTTYSNSTYYGYGPDGTPIRAINSTTTTGESKTLYTIQFQTPVQAGDQVVVELNDGNGWFNSAQRFTTMTHNAASYGVAIIAINSTTYRVAFGNAGYGSSGAATYGAAGGAWSSVTSWRWRVRKSSAGAAVGFGIVSPGTSAGLVSAAGLPGNTTGNVIAQGYVGENYSFQTGSNVAVTTAWNNVLTMSNLPAGIWLLTGMAELNNAGGVTGFNLAISAFAGTTTTDHVRGVNQLPCTVPTNTGGSITIANWLVNISTPAPYYLKAISVGGSSTLNCSLRAIRIA